MDNIYLSDIQPQLFPRLHYFSRMLNSNFFVFRDDVQFVRNHRYPDGGRHSSYQIHTPTLSGNGVLLLNAQIKKKSGLKINQQQLSYEPDWTKKFINLFDQSYRKAQYYSAIRSDLVELLDVRYQSLAELNIATTLWGLCRLFDEPYSPDMSLSVVNTMLASHTGCKLQSLHLGSETLGPADEDKSATERILQLCRHYRCNAYIAGGTAIDSYFELDKFQAATVTVCRQNWHCDAYVQTKPGKAAEEFAANLSIIDLLANVPADEAFGIVNGNFSLDQE